MKNSRDLWLQILSSTIGSFLFTLIGTAYFYFTRKTQLESSIADLLLSTISIPIWLVLILLFASLWVTIYLVVNNKLVKHGHVATLDHNLTILKQRNKDVENSIIYSTRFTSWPKKEGHFKRHSFRLELDMAITREKREVKRIWSIKNKEDIDRLIDVLKDFEGHNNISIRYFSYPPYLLPELLVVDNKATISYPQTRNPFEIEVCRIFNDRDSVKLIKNYFNVLWNESTPIMENGKIVNHNNLRSSLLKVIE